MRERKMCSASDFCISSRRLVIRFMEVRFYHHGDTHESLPFVRRTINDDKFYHYR